MTSSEPEKKKEIEGIMMNYIKTYFIILTQFQVLMLADTELLFLNTEAIETREIDDKDIQSFSSGG